IDAEAARTGVTPEDIGDKIFKHTDGTVCNIPGLPPMYDWEWFPQKLPFDIPMSMALRGCYSLLEQCDGILLTTAHAAEPVAVEALRSWFSTWNKSTHVIGPLLPSGFGTVKQTSRGATDVEEFLDKAAAQFGDKSVLFISFGTFYYPTEPGYVEELLEALIEKKFPFIFCSASPFAKMSDELIKKTTSSGLGFITKWAPQQFILSHPATGWFLTHCGHNSVMESLACGVPLIAWPIEADQPGAAAHLTEHLNVAFELIEVRTGVNGLKPLLRNGQSAKGSREAVGAEIRNVIDECRGAKGEQMRGNALALKTKFIEAWGPDGAPTPVLSSPRCDNVVEIIYILWASSKVNKVIDVAGVTELEIVPLHRIFQLPLLRHDLDIARRLLLPQEELRRYYFLPAMRPSPYRSRSSNALSTSNSWRKGNLSSLLETRNFSLLNRLPNSLSRWFLVAIIFLGGFIVRKERPLIGAIISRSTLHIESDMSTVEMTSRFFFKSPMPAIKHYVFTAFPAWGHVRPFCILGARLAKEDENNVITMILDPKLLDKAHQEVSAELRNELSRDVLRRIRIVGAYEPTDSVDVVQLMKVLAESYVGTYRALVQSNAITCAVTGTVFDPVSPPNVVILDFFAFPQLQATRAITGQSVPIFAWMTGHASSILRLYGPEEIGGIGNLGARIDAEAARTGVAPEEIGDKIFKHTDGTVCNIPGLPAMYDWEWFPQKACLPQSAQLSFCLPFDIPISMAMRGCYSLLEQCDGILLSTAHAAEPVALEAVRSWFSTWDKSTHVIGPLLPSGFGTMKQTSRGAKDVEEFLDTAVSRFDEKSVLFISFGTFFYPTDPAYVEELLEALIEKEFPFIFCYASPFAKMSDELIKKATSSGLGLITKWAPQQFILSHPATGWFLTHCGHNSVMESLACGIPLIAWPFEADQPGAAAHLTEHLKVAFELIEVRTGENGLKPLLRNGRSAEGSRVAVGAEIRAVIDASRGPRGEQMRKNATTLKTKFIEAWEADGVSKKELQDFKIFAKLHE
ncbi:hypothetical protein CVT26_010751, partial [Gymnopilus dilepis]